MSWSSMASSRLIIPDSHRRADDSSFGLISTETFSRRRDNVTTSSNARANASINFFLPKWADERATNDVAIACGIPPSADGGIPPSPADGGSSIRRSDAIRYEAFRYEVFRIDAFRPFDYYRASSSSIDVLTLVRTSSASSRTRSISMLIS